MVLKIAIIIKDKQKQKSKRKGIKKAGI